MKKFYVLTVVCIGLCIQGFGQTFTWNGGVSGNWNNSANWLPIGIPDAPGESAIFNSSAIVTFDVTAGTPPGNITLNSLAVTGTGTEVTITTTDESIKKITLTNTSTSPGALNINEGTTLRLTTGEESVMEFIVAANSKSIIDGVLSLEGADNVDFFPVFVVAGIDGNTTEVNVSNTGSIIVKNSSASILAPIDGFLKFNEGSELVIECNVATIPLAEYDPSSEIIITGKITGDVSVEEITLIGNLTYNCTGQLGLVRLKLSDNITVAGSLNVLGTNGNTLVLMSNQALSGSPTELNLTVNGNFNIDNNSKVALSSSDAVNNNYTATIGGNLIAGGTEFSLQNSIVPGLTGITTLAVKGNIQHTAGNFTVLCSEINESVSLYNVEMNGGGAQSISSVSGIFDNNNHQITLKINKPSSTGVVNLSSPLAVGRLNLTSGTLNTSTNYLAIRNTSGQPIVLSSSPSSFIEGAVRRDATSTSELIFPTGAGTVKRPISIVPSSSTLTTFEATYFNTSSGNNSVMTPLEGIEQNYYWNVQRISGSADAKVRLTLDAAIAGADAADAIVVAKYDGSNWVRARGASTGYIPGNQTTGTAETDAQTSFGLYTFGYGVQAAVLPINLESFNAKKVNSSAQLNWKISENSNPVSFEIMKSGDGINFSKIGAVTALDGKLNYDFIDNSLLAGNNYYRLRMLDKDGKTSFSSIVVIMNGTKGVMISSMIPTMVVDRARLNITSSVKGNMQLVITDISGRIMQNQNVSINSGNQEVWMNASRLSSGIYQVTGYINGEKTATMRFFKR